MLLAVLLLNILIRVQVLHDAVDKVIQTGDGSLLHGSTDLVFFYTEDFMHLLGVTVSLVHLANRLYQETSLLDLFLLPLVAELGGV
jgi:hypothetical protein